MTSQQTLLKRVYEADGIQIDFFDAGASRTIVRFASFGQEASPVSNTEFVRFLLSLRLGPPEKKFNLVAVADVERRYYLDGRAERLVETVNDLIVFTGSSTTIALGVSMGGFAAVGFARRLVRCRHVVAIAPFSSVRPTLVPFDQRNISYKNSIRSWDISDCLDEISDHIFYELVFGGKDMTDLAHANRFASLGRSNVSMEIIEDSRHNVAAHWHAAGDLEKQILHRIERLEDRHLERLQPGRPREPV